MLKGPVQQEAAQPTKSRPIHVTPQKPSNARAKASLLETGWDFYSRKNGKHTQKKQRPKVQQQTIIRVQSRGRDAFLRQRDHTPSTQPDEA